MVHDRPPDLEPAESPAWMAARRRRLRGFGFAALALVSAGAATLGAIAVPSLSWLVPAAWTGTLWTVLILVVLAPTILLTAASGLMFGLTVGWPRSRVVSNVIMLFVFSIFGGLWLLPMFGLAEQHVAYVVVGGTLGLTFLVAPTVFGMMVRGVVRDGEGEASEERA